MTTYLLNFKNLVDIERVESVLQNRLGPEPPAHQLVFVFLHTLKNETVCDQNRIEADHFFCLQDYMLQSAIPKLILYFIFSKGNALPNKGHQDVHRGRPHNMLTLYV
jgi:hypothetical protein